MKLNDNTYGLLKFASVVLCTFHDMIQRSRTEGQRLANMSLTNAATRSLKLLESHNEEGVVADEAEDENELNDEEATPVVDRLHMLYFKKFKKEPFSTNEKEFLVGVMNKKSCIQEKLFGHASKLLLKRDLDAREEIMLKLTLSGVVNTMEPEGYEILKNIFGQEEITILEDPPNSMHIGLSEVNMEALDRVLKSGGEQMDLEAIEEKILREQLRLRGLKMKNKDSELTCYRHFAKLLDCLFKYTDLMLLDGEPSCIAVKEEMIAGQSLHPCLSVNVLSTTAIRKIDAIVAAQVEEERVEFSANEWKKDNATTTSAIKQQSKNLRSNLSILNQLERKFDVQTKSILAVDFVGKYL
ncbi:hypothetical protein A0J61_08769 [Choanephora cucurbitarum]|uniref:Uncharacterized protein n=1 Tax=Choanephora cucurbitarum TaxID=101091 RepID=A0A1C7N246_9FUNG|nr:hypothetical protein A0J61_08769 [Choanephora cucurbitarum]